ncbi:MAG: hypothetical protein CL868_16670 [Cytophagaceae bacterium]|nr:hypothetical protein [Cytophagaceae bacterium]|tara:strand:+ start:324 stop:1247 length:924 start_codon:yes stop_codon:yes gene_type:complete
MIPSSFLRPLALSLLILIISCKKTETGAPGIKAAIRVSAATVTQQPITEYLTFNGTTVYQKKEDIRANITGYITSMPYKVGDRISKGQVFALVRTKEQDALRDAIKIDTSLAKFIHPITIKSNAGGILNVVNVNVDDYIAEGDVLASIIQPQSLVVQVNVPYEYRGAVHLDTPCEILLPDGKVITASVIKALPTMDIASQSQTFLIGVPQDEELPENLNVEVKIVQKEDAGLLTVPKTALQANELLTQYWVLRLVQDSLAIKTPVKPGLKNDSLIQVESPGLRLNDRVVTTGAYQMQDSTVVKIQNQ